MAHPKTVFAQFVNASAFVGKYNSLNDHVLQHMSTKVLDLNIPLLMSVPQFSFKMLERLKEHGFCRKV